MILPFKPQFQEPIITGTKIHTIRIDAHQRWYKGRVIQMATGVRTKNYNCFKEAICTGTQRIFMTYAYNDIIEISIDDKYIYDRESLAKADGFESYKEFFDWFYPLIMKNKDQCFSGRIIHWTDFRY